MLRPGGYLLVYDGDHAPTTVALAEHDPLEACVAAAIGALVHHPWLARRLGPVLRAAGFQPGELRSHGYLETDSPGYMLSLVEVGADTLAARATLSAPTAAILKAEARRRADESQFFGHIAYASVRATWWVSPPQGRVQRADAAAERKPGDVAGLVLAAYRLLRQDSC